MIIVKLPNFIQDNLKNGQIFFRQPIYSCPSCNFEGKLYNHGSYERNVITEVESCKITIFRVKCPICGKTHVLIPDFLIPYFQYSLKTILKCLDLKYIEKASYSVILDYFHIKNINSYMSAAAISIFVRRFTFVVPKLRLFFSTFTSLYCHESTSEAELLNHIHSYDSSNDTRFNLHYFQNMPNYFMAGA